MSPARKTRRRPRSRPDPLKCRQCGAVLSPYGIEAEAAAYVRRAPQTLRNLRVTGKGGPPYQQMEPGGTVTYSWSDLDEWMRSYTRYSTSDAVVGGKGSSAAPAARQQ